MKTKLRLDLDALEVESFDTDVSRGAEGTVHARAVTLYTIDCSGCNTGSEPDSQYSECYTACVDDCGGTFYQTCRGDSCDPETCMSCEVCDKSWRYTDCQGSCLC
jgi:hypothetical protein